MNLLKSSSKLNLQSSIFQENYGYWLFHSTYVQKFSVEIGCKGERLWDIRILDTFPPASYYKSPLLPKSELYIYS